MEQRKMSEEKKAKNEWVHFRELRARCPVCKKVAHVACKNGTYFFVHDAYDPFARHNAVETGNQFVSLSDAARAVGLRNGNSIRRAIDRGGTAGGYHWEYLDEKKEVSTDDHHQADGRAE